MSLKSHNSAKDKDKLKKSAELSFLKIVQTFMFDLINFSDFCNIFNLMPTGFRVRTDRQRKAGKDGKC